MKIIKAIVDELPMSCHACEFSERIYHDEAECGLTYTLIGFPHSGRLPNCPLQPEQSCENCKHGDMASDPNLCTWNPKSYKPVMASECSRWEEKKDV